MKHSLLMNRFPDIFITGRNFISGNYFSNLLTGIIISVIFFQSILTAQVQENPARHKVLLINSYHQGFKWTDEITEGVKSYFAGKAIELYIEYLDTKRHYDTLLFGKTAEALSIKYSATKFDAVITSDNDAFEFFKKYGNNISPNSPFIFCGVNYVSRHQLEGVREVTGVNERVDIQKNLELIESVHPECKNIVIITDSSTTGIRLQAEIRKIQSEQLPRYPAIKTLISVTKTELIDSVKKLNEGSVILYSIFFRDRNGQYVDNDEITKLVAESSKVPVYGLWSFSLGNGIVGGWLADGFYQGEEAANTAYLVISGMPADEIPVLYETPTKLYFDYKMIKKTGVEERRLPVSAEFINKPESIYQKYKNYLWTVSIIFVLLIISILSMGYAYMRKRKTAAILTVSRENLRTTLNSIGEAVISTDIRGKITQMNPVAEQMTGWNLTEAKGKDLIEVFRIVNPITGFVMKNPVDKVLADGKVVGLANHTRLISKTGEEFQIADTAASIKNHEGEVSGVVLVFRNVTEEYRIKEALRDSEETFRSIIEALPMGLSIYELDNSGSLVFMGCNPAVVKYLPGEKASLIGKTFEDIYPELIGSGLLKQYYKTADTGIPWSGELFIPGQDGNSIVYELICFRMAPKRLAIISNEITSKKRMEEALKESEEKFRNMAEMLPEIIFEADSNLNITYGNRRAYEKFAVTREDFERGINILELIVREDQERAINNYSQRLKGEKLGMVEYTAQARDGSTFPFLLNFDPVIKNNKVTGARGILVDISERKKSETLIKRRLEFEEILVKSAWEIINSKEETWEVTIDNVLTQIAEFSKVKRAVLMQVVEKHFLTTTHEWNSEDFEKLKQKTQRVALEAIPNITAHLRAGKEVFIEDTSNLPDHWEKEKIIFRERKASNVLIVPVSNEGELLGLIGLDEIENISKLDREHVRLIGVLGSIIGTVLNRMSQHTELVESKTKAEISDRLKSEFLAQVSHEIRTPVNAILSFAGLLETLLEDNNDEDVKDSLRAMNNSGKRIIRTIDLIINMSQIQTGSYDLKLKQFDLCKELLPGINDEYKRIAYNKNLQFEFIKNTVDTAVFADEYTVGQILHNLVDNAFKYTSTGSVAIMLDRHENRRLSLSVKDTGIGIEQEYLPHIFEAFSQEEQGYSRRFDGNGLGLALVKSYCELNGIKISVESLKGKGSTFTILFP